MFLKQMKGLSSVLNGSSGFWTDKISNLGKEFCSCTRGDLEQNVEMEDEKKVEQKNNINYETFSTIGKNLI